MGAVTRSDFLKTLSGLAVGYIAWTLGTGFYMAMDAIKAVSENSLQIVVLQEQMKYLERDLEHIKSGHKAHSGDGPSNVVSRDNYNIRCVGDDAVGGSIRYIGACGGIADMPGSGSGDVLVAGGQRRIPDIPPDRRGNDFSILDQLFIPSKYIFRLVSVNHAKYSDNLHFNDRGSG